MDTARLTFNINIVIQSNASNTPQNLHLGPTEPFSATLDAQVTAQLLGDLSSYNSMPDFSSYYLMIPTPTGALESALSMSQLVFALHMSVLGGMS